eukprot:1858310-Prymnesium_polylepis.1
MVRRKAVLERYAALRCPWHEVGVRPSPCPAASPLHQLALPLRWRYEWLREPVAGGKPVSIVQNISGDLSSTAERSRT